MSVNWQSITERDQASKLTKLWVEITIDQALPLLSGFFSLNEVYSHMRIVNPSNEEIRKKFKVIRNHAVECLKK
jgi:hypothetical protein